MTAEVQTIGALEKVVKMTDYVPVITITFHPFCRLVLVDCIHVQSNTLTGESNSAYGQFVLDNFTFSRRELCVASWHRNNVNIIDQYCSADNSNAEDIMLPMILVINLF